MVLVDLAEPVRVNDVPEHTAEWVILHKDQAPHEHALLPMSGPDSDVAGDSDGERISSPDSATVKKIIPFRLERPGGGFLDVLKARLARAQPPPLATVQPMLAFAPRPRTPLAAQEEPRGEIF